jgi:hypothetical protein
MDTVSCCNDCLLKKNTTYLAALDGNLDCLKYAHEHGCPWHKGTTYIAARNGHLKCLMYAHENGCPWNTETTYWAAQNGNLECLIYAHENGCPWDKDTTNTAAVCGNTDCLKYIYFSCQSIISSEDKEIILPYINKWKELVDAALDDKLVPKDIKDIIYTFW